MEDFVDFETAKKLKEKGFPQHWSDHHYILENEYEDDFFEVGAKYPVEVIYDYIPTIAAPTIAQVLKWLRDEKIHICIDICDDGWFFDVAFFYKEDTGAYEIKLSYMPSNVRLNYDSFEQAALAGIEYVLDNLI